MLLRIIKHVFYIFDIHFFNQLIPMKDFLKYTLATITGIFLVSILFFTGLVLAIITNPWMHIVPVVPDESTRQIGRLLLTDYLLAFEFSSITLLASLIGAAYLVRRQEP